MQNTITKQGVNCEYQVINRELFFKFLDEELKNDFSYSYNAFLVEAENDLNIGNSSYELHSVYTKSGNHAHYDFWL